MCQPDCEKIHMILIRTDFIFLNIAVNRHPIRLTPDGKRPIDDAIEVSGLGSSVWCKKSLQYIVANGICIT